MTSPCNNTDFRSCEEIGSVGVSVMALSLGIIFALSVILNGVVCLVFYKKPHLLSVSNTFVLNLSCCELALSLMVLPFTLTSVFSTSWLFNDTWCKIQGYLFTVCQVAIQLSLMVISMDRYYAIINSLRYPYIFTQRLGHILIASSWVLSLIVSVPPLTGFGQYDYNFNKYMCSLNVVLSRFYLVFLSTSAFLVPILLQAWCYLSIFRAAVSHTKRRSKVYPSMSSTTRDPPSDSSDNSELSHSVQVHYRNMECKAVRTILIIAFAYCICWIPNFVSTLSVFTGYHVHASTESAAICFVFLSGIVNPVIYAFMNRITRYEINKFFCDAVSRVSGKTTTLNDSEDYFSTTTTNFSTKNNGSASHQRFRTGSKTATSSRGIEMNTIQEETETEIENSRVIPEEKFPEPNSTEPELYELPAKEIVLEPSALYIHSSKRKKSIIKVLPIDSTFADDGVESKWKAIEEMDKHWNACVTYSSDRISRQRIKRANSDFLSEGRTFLNKSKDCGSFLYFDRYSSKHRHRSKDRMRRRGRLSLDVSEISSISRHAPRLQSIHEAENDVTELHNSENFHTIRINSVKIPVDKLDSHIRTTDYLDESYRDGNRQQQFTGHRSVSPLWLDGESNSRTFDGTIISERRCFSA